MTQNFFIIAWPDKATTEKKIIFMKQKAFSFVYSVISNTSQSCSLLGIDFMAKQIKYLYEDKILLN